MSPATPDYLGAGTAEREPNSVATRGWAVGGRLLERFPVHQTRHQRSTGVIPVTAEFLGSPRSFLVSVRHRFGPEIRQSSDPRVDRQLMEIDLHGAGADYTAVITDLGFRTCRGFDRPVEFYSWLRETHAESAIMIAEQI